ncbi:hypothetical protein [Paenibacillus albus]|uniref:Uncharacterized protein n=1 Tax=Paenibacillus albus TaxID=2495582 RepID=A0A3Q8X7G1_9BACL|nr:hypothetical protein [Paenibacillus albus]AZN41760.1 hypothetical protein EJC50_20345 [Paenibacillus albus]
MKNLMFTKRNIIIVVGNALAYIILGFLLFMVLVMLGAIESNDRVKEIINIFVSVIVGLILLGAIAWCVNAFVISRFKRDK